MIERKIIATAKIATFAVVHGVYFKQFEGLKESLQKYHDDFVEKIKSNGVEVVDFGMVEENSVAFDIAHKIQSANVDLIMCNMVTYATSSVFTPILQNCSAPMILVALQPLKALDYQKACTYMQLENDNICSVPEFTGVANRMGKKIYDVVIGTLYGDVEADSELLKWCNIAKALHGLKGARLGLMGHTMEAMYDMHADPTAIAAALGRMPLNS